MSLTSRVISDIIKGNIRDSLSKVGQIAIGEAFFDPNDALGYVSVDGTPIHYKDLAHQQRVEGTINVIIEGSDTTRVKLLSVPVPQDSTQPGILSSCIKEKDKVLVYFAAGSPEFTIPVSFGAGIDRYDIKERAKTLPKPESSEKGIAYK